MRPVVRHAATTLAVTALVLLGVRPERTITIHPADALLVTPGAGAARVRRLADSLGTARVLSLTGADSLPDAGYVARHFGDARRLHVVGWGLRDEEWQALGTAPASVHPAARPPGFAAAAWPRTLALGDELRVDGSLLGRPQTRVYLGDRSGPLDSATVGPDGAFALVTRPRAAGRQAYALWSAGVAAETIGVVVTPPPRWRTLILTAAPSFEAAALRDLLVARGSPVTWRAGVSRERTRTEFVNRSAGGEPLDLVVVDGRTLMAQSAAERTALLRAVADSGLGLLLLPDGSLEAAAAGVGFALTPDTALTERLVRPRTADGRPAATPVPAEPYRLRDAFGVRAVLWGSAGEILAQVSPRGAGRIAVTLVSAPSRWIRAGERTAFAAYWAPLLAATAGGPAGDRWMVGGLAPERAQQAVEIALRTQRPNPVAVVAAPEGQRDSVYLTPDALEPGRRLGRYWPRHAGWHEIAGAGDVAFYVAPAESWPGARAAERLAATARWAASAPVAGPEQATRTQRRPFPLWWWLGVFVLAAGVLWADRRRAYIRAMPRTAVVLLLLALGACSKSEEKRRGEVERCSAMSSDAQIIAVCLMTEHKWKDAAADSAGRLKAHEIDSTRTAQEDSMWNADAARHTAALRQCSAGNDPKECLLVRFGWSDARATRAADSLWNRAGDRHLREVRSCARGRNPMASCLMLNYKWNARRAMATEDSVRRARMR